ncbi:MAG TPA: hypothetical protein VLE96_02385, partial [Chlamydiales bacterium]|nr:hypothetical protein [Chlamydiales bacterium]
LACLIHAVSIRSELRSNSQKNYLLLCFMNRLSTTHTNQFLLFFYCQNGFQKVSLSVFESWFISYQDRK